MDAKKPNAAGRIAIAAAIALACGASLADEACSLSTLQGLYVGHAQGWGLIGGAWQPRAVMELERFNGDGTITILAVTVANRAGDGAISTQAPAGVTYTLEANCTGTINVPSGPTLNIVASPKGDDVWRIQANPNNVFQGTYTRISR
jgi:hypothetical protein